MDLRLNRKANFRPPQSHNQDPGQHVTQDDSIPRRLHYGDLHLDQGHRANVSDYSSCYEVISSERGRRRRGYPRGETGCTVAVASDTTPNVPDVTDHHEFIRADRDVAANPETPLPAPAPASIAAFPLAVLKFMEVPIDDFSSYAQVLEIFPTVLRGDVIALQSRAITAYRDKSFDQGERIVQQMLLIHLFQVWHLSQVRAIVFVNGLADEKSGRSPPHRLNRFESRAETLTRYLRLKCCTTIPPRTPRRGVYHGLADSQGELQQNASLPGLPRDRVAMPANHSDARSCSDDTGTFHTTASPGLMEKKLSILNALQPFDQSGIDPDVSAFKGVRIQISQHLLPQPQMLLALFGCLTTDKIRELVWSFLEYQKDAQTQDGSQALPRDAPATQYPSLPFADRLPSTDPGRAKHTGAGHLRDIGQGMGEAEDGQSLQIGLADHGKKQNTQAFACHFHKLDPQKFSSGRYKSCPNPYDGLNRLKQHQKRAHMPPHYCRRCKTVFKTQDEKDLHDMSALRCTECDDPNFEDYLTRDSQRNLLGKKKANAQCTDVNHWFEMWDAFFPWAPRPESPYKDEFDSEAVRYVEFAEQQTNAVVQQFRCRYPRLNTNDIDLKEFFRFAIRQCLQMFPTPKLQHRPDEEADLPDPALLGHFATVDEDMLDLLTAENIPHGIFMSSQVVLPPETPAEPTRPSYPVTNPVLADAYLENLPIQYPATTLEPNDYDPPLPQYVSPKALLSFNSTRSNWH